MTQTTFDSGDEGFRIDASALERTVAQRFKQVLIGTGVVLLIVGLLMMFWPGHTAKVVTALLAIAVLFTAIGNLTVALTPGIPRKARIISGVLAALFAFSGFWALFHLNSTTIGLAFIVGLFVGVTWIIDGISALVTIGDAASKVWAVAFAVISIVAGVILLIAPITGAKTIWVILGIIFIVMGAAQIVRGLRFGNQTIKAAV